MFDVAGGLPPLFADLGLWVGLGLSLALFSLLLGDNVVARLAQHVLVGAGMGFLAVVVMQHITAPRLVEPLLRGEWATHAAPLFLALTLLAAGAERIVRQSRQPQGSASDGGAKGRDLWGLLAVVPLALLLGTGLAVGLVGIVQGTLWPQASVVLLGTWPNGRMGSAFNSQPQAFWYGALSLLLTTGTLLHLTLDRSRHVDPLPQPFRDLMRGWVWVGQRALWIVAGVLLARLFVSRFTIFFERVDVTARALHETGLWQWLATLWAWFTA